MSCRHPQTQGGYPMSKHEELIKSLRASAAAMPFDAAVAVQYRAAADALEAQAREIEGLRKDAARYRWLRHGDNDEKVLKTYTSRPSKPGETTMFLPRNGELDRLIDTARATQEGKK